MHKFTKCHCMSRSTCFSRTADDILQNPIRNLSIVLSIYLLPAYFFFYCHIFDKTNHLQVLHPLYNILGTRKKINKLTCYFYSLFTFVHRQVTIYRKLLGIFLFISQGTNLHHHKKLSDSSLMIYLLHKYHKHPTLYLVLISITSIVIPHLMTFFYFTFLKKKCINDSTFFYFFSQFTCDSFQ